ncbi:uncharacterized protein LOC134719255 [Mytilus trossulus]|uniref:uncharacterized protein LOC134719255 n=1 Tax=Mytilus trossulus TaxID=6551 RepID=UPI003006EB9A
MGLWLDTADVRACARLQRPLHLMVNNTVRRNHEDTEYNAQVIECQTQNHSGLAPARAVKMRKGLGGQVVVTPSREWAFSHLIPPSWMKPTTGEGSGGKYLTRKDLWRIAQYCWRYQQYPK